MISKRDLQKVVFKYLCSVTLKQKHFYAFHLLVNQKLMVVIHF